MAVIEGKTLECLKHYLSQLPWDTKMCVQARRQIIDFLDVTPHTVRRWWTGDIVPVGLVLVKLRYFLEREGYRVSELNDLDATTRALGMLIAYGSIDFDATVIQLKCPNASEFLRVLHGARRFTAARDLAAEAICVKNRDVLAKLFFTSPGNGHPAPVITPVVTPAQVKEKAPGAGEELIKYLRLFSGILELLHPRLNDFLSEEVSPEERHELRERAGRELVYDLARRSKQVTELMTALCSEKAREISNTLAGARKERGE
ncbi:MAG: hypothetical protein NTW66_00365 [Candidatus Magasanikbacteria bacterium]|nr:hypothetical protein [Candidatus Magasanikbacteria bacterium]